MKDCRDFNAEDVMKKTTYVNNFFKANNKNQNQISLSPIQKRTILIQSAIESPVNKIQ